MTDSELTFDLKADDDEENGGINFALEEVLGLNKEEGVAMMCGGEHHSMLLTENGNQKINKIVSRPWLTQPSSVSANVAPFH